MGNEEKKKFEFVMLCKFVAILVVVGHYHGGGFHSESFILIKSYLMPFRMPLFISLSGFLFFLSSSKHDYFRFVRKKFESIMVPYFAIYLIFFAFKLSASALFSFTKPAVWGDLYYIFLEPKAGFESFLWFLYVLFMFFVVSPLILKISHGFLIMGCIAFVLYFLTLPTVLCLNLFGEYYLWFWLGGVLSRHHEKIRIHWMSLVVYGVLYFGSLYAVSTVGMQRPLLLLPQFFGSVFVIGICKWMENFPNAMKAVFLYLGENSYSIYIWHNSLVMPPVVYFYKKIFGIRTELGFYIGLLVSLVACTVLPPVISRFFEMNWVTRRLFLGRR